MVTVPSPDSSRDIPAETFTLSAPATVDMTYPSTTEITLTPSGALGSVLYTYTVTPDEGLEVSFAGGNTVYLTTLAAGTYTVTITATDQGRTTNNTATATITVRATVGGGSVGSSGGGCDSGLGVMSLAALGLVLLRKNRQ